MRIESSVTCISWIPSEAVQGLPRLGFSTGVAHYDRPPPEDIGAPGEGRLEELAATDRLRFANHLRAWVDVEDGRITGYGYDETSGGRIGSTHVRLGRADLDVGATALPDLVRDPEVGDGWVRFRQTSGGRTGLPAPRTVAHPPFVQYQAPIGWSTLQLTLHAGGQVDAELTGASVFPRHWMYDHSGALVQKSGVIDFNEWWKHSFGKHTPWGDMDSPALVTQVETALERQLSTTIMRGGRKPSVRKVKKGRALVEQGEQGAELYLLLDGVLAVEVDGRALAELGPGTVMGERALLEGGLRTATLRAVTPCRVAVAGAADIDPAVLAELREGHRREEGAAAAPDGDVVGVPRE
ncbi:MAG TPA: cyclic nucleotide-binding domain-containing protein [Acidimicrobiales bacterium]|nr:cyclic nucleotide-binding domain-containing protein [Acidimicrobiales bacterium]